MVSWCSGIASRFTTTPPVDSGKPGLRPAWLISQAGAEHGDGVEIQLGVETALDVAAFAEAVLLAGEEKIADRLAAAAERLCKL